MGSLASSATVSHKISTAPGGGPRWHAPATSPLPSPREWPAQTNPLEKFMISAGRLETSGALNIVSTSTGDPWRPQGLGH